MPIEILEIKQIHLESNLESIEVFITKKKKLKQIL